MSNTSAIKGPVLFTVQPYFLSVEKTFGFADEKDFYKFAAEEAGFTAVSHPVHPAFFDFDEARKSAGYRADRLGFFRDLGLPVVRFENHTTMGCRSIAASHVKRHAHFLGQPLDVSRHQLEQEASRAFRQSVEDIVACGLDEIVGFPGNRGFAAAAFRWSSWPKGLRHWVIALLAAKWQKDLEFAADAGIKKVTFEIGHPETDLLTGKNLKLFRKMLSRKARSVVGPNADKSHFDMTGVNGVPHFLVGVEPVDAEDAGAPATCHCKSGIVRAVQPGISSAYSGWENFGDASHTFATFGLADDLDELEAFADFVDAHADGVFVWEGECVIVPNVRQSMKIGAANTRAVMERKFDDLYRLEGAVGFSRQQPIDASGKILAPNGERIDIESWEGGPFDAFADSPAKPWDLLEMTADEIEATVTILSDAGFNETSLGFPAALEALARMKAI
jgi:hypothetical protein